MNEEEAKHLAGELANKLDWDRNWSPATSGSMNDGWIVSFIDQLGQIKKVIIVRPDNLNTYISSSRIAQCWLEQMQSIAKAKAGKAIFKIGFPVSSVCEMALRLGQYQFFEHGTIIDREKNRANEPIFVAINMSENPQKIYAFIAFFDLRGFTSWSKDKEPANIRDVLSRFEIILQNELTILNSNFDFKPFIKGTGDGVMLVFLAYVNSPNEGWKPRSMDVQLPISLLRTCANVIQSVRNILPSDLALGCGLDCGEIVKAFIFGEWDYFGDKVNNAAKLQQSARDEIIVSSEFQNKLVTLNPRLSSKGRVSGSTRYSPQDIMNALNNAQ